MKAALPDNEAARLKALCEYKLLDTSCEKVFDDITQLAACICGTPIALVSLVDANRQWFKSKVGLEATETPRDIAFCAHAILQTDVLIVPNTLDDKRFATNPLVLSSPNIRFYAGVPLITSENHALGTLCVIDYVPRKLEPHQLEALRALSRQVVKEIELRRSVVKLERAALKLQKTERWRRQFFKRIAAGLGLASAILVGVGFVSYRSLNTLVQTHDWQTQHYKVLEKLKDIRSHTQKAAIAKHRYITSGESSYLEPYYNAAKDISQEIRALRQAIANISIPNRDSYTTAAPTSDITTHSRRGNVSHANENHYNFKQQRYLATLEALINKKFAEIEETSKLRKTRGFEAASQPVALQKAKKLTDDIEATIREMEKAENISFTQALQEEKASTRNAIFTFSGGIFLNFLTLIGVYYFIYQEIASRKHTEVALEQERDFTAAILDTVGALVVVFDPQGRIIRFNRTCEQTTGYCFDEVQGKYFWDLLLIPADEVVEVRAVLAKLLAADQLSNHHKNYWVTREGDRRLIAWSNTVLLDKDGDLKYIISTGIDITERQQAEQNLQESEKKYRYVVDNVKEVIFQTDAIGLWTFLNPAWTEITGFSIEESLGTPFLDYIHPDDRQHNWELFQPLIARQKEYCRYEVRYLTKNGSFCWTEVYERVILDTDNNIIGTCGTLNDVTERKQTAVALQQANENLTSWVNELKQRNREIALLGEMSDVLQACHTVEEAYSAIAQLVQPLFPETSGGIFLIKPSKNIVEAVATWGSPPLPSQKLFKPDDCWALRRGRVHWVEEDGLQCEHAHHALPAQSLCVPMMAQGKTLGLLHLNSQELGRLTEAKQQLATTVAEHIALALANLKLRETLQNQSIRDPLTGLFNRRYMEESLEREIYRCDRACVPLSIIMIDIDHFKRFNDRFGHEAGDTVLRELGLFLQKHIRGSDIPCRYGGEELTLILPETSLDIVQQRAEQLRQGVKHLMVLYRNQQLDAIALSLGVACFPEHGLTGEAVLAAADAALYHAKAQGRDRVVTAS